MAKMPTLTHLAIKATFSYCCVDYLAIALRATAEIIMGVNPN